MDTIVKDVEVTLNQNGLPEEITLEDEEGIVQHINVLSVCLQEALTARISGHYNPNGYIYAYQYKARICPNNRLLTVKLYHYREDGRWTLEI